MVVKKIHLQFNYSDTAVPGDNPDKRKVDSEYLHRSESYEMIDFIQSLNPRNTTEVHLIERWTREHEPHKKLKRLYLFSYISTKLQIYRSTHL